MTVSGPLYVAQCALNARLTPEDRMSADERACRRRARDAEWRFRVSKGYEKDTFWNKVKFRLTHSE